MKINFNNIKYRKLAVISDPHLFHNKPFIYNARKKKDEKDHRDSVLKDLYSLNREDILVCLGDTFLNCELEDAKKIVRDIPCRTLFLFGNHPSGIKQMYEEALGKREVILGVPQDVFPTEIEDGKYVLGNDFYAKIGANNYYFSHFAPLTWDHMQHGCVACCGHSHGNLPEIGIYTDAHGKILDCGVDNALKYNNKSFFWIDEIDSIMSTKKMKIWDHHN